MALPPDSPLLDEWSLVCLDLQVSAVLVGRERPRARATDPRVFEAVLSLAPDVVAGAVRRSVALAEAAGVATPPDLVERTVSGPPSELRTISLLRRFAVYADERHR